MHKVKILFCVTSLKGMRYKTAWYVLGKNSWLRVAEKVTERGECQLILKKKRLNYEVLGKHIKRFGHHQKSIGINIGFQ